MNRAQKRLTVICLVPFLLSGLLLGTTRDDSNVKGALTVCGLILVAYAALFFVFQSPKK